MVLMAEGGLNISLEVWTNRLKALPGLPLPYDLVPKRDAEIEPA
jgi:glutathione S-transferase